MNKKNIIRVKFAIFILVILVAVLLLVLNWHTIRNMNVETILMLIEEKENYSTLVYILIFIIKPFLILVPSNVLVIIGGILFGPVKGFLLNMLGFFISGTISFYISRLLGRDFVEGIVGKRFIKLDRNLEERGFKILFLLRLPPVLPYDALSYACGLTKIKYRDFIAASLLGVVPETICYSIMGKSFSNPLSPSFIIPIGIIIIATLFSRKLFRVGNKTN